MHIAETIGENRSIFAGRTKLCVMRFLGESLEASLDLYSGFPLSFRSLAAFRSRITLAYVSLRTKKAATVTTPA